LDAYFFLVFQLRRTVTLDGGQHLRVFADAWRSIKDDVFQIVDFFRKVTQYFIHLGM
jgi:hypothetical protein